MSVPSTTEACLDDFPCGTDVNKSSAGFYGT